MAAITAWIFCSIGMMVFNDYAVEAMPLPCTLVSIQMAVTVILMVTCCWSTLHVGSFRDFARWCRVPPFFAGVLLTSILALKDAPMSVTVVFRSLAPMFSMVIEAFYPSPLRISKPMVLSMTGMVGGAFLYCWDLERSSIKGIGWVMLNNMFVICDKLLMRMMLSKDQAPVDISKTSITLINNLLGMVPLLFVAVPTGEIDQLPSVLTSMNAEGLLYIMLSCFVGVGISYCGIWAQSLVSATTFLVVATGSKFFIVLIEKFIMKSKTLTPVQCIAAVITVGSSVLYGKAREAMHSEMAPKTDAEEAAETAPLINKTI